ncbi:MAG: hypothetical protein AAF921_18640 [Cyanobacteria bacterium P01_D01_bin.44]
MKVSLKAVLMGGLVVGLLGGSANAQLNQPIITTEPPLPGQLSDPIASVTPVNGRITIELKNETGASLTYEVFGVTDQRTLMAEESATLQNIPLAATITALRQDNGLIDITASSEEAGLLTISILRETNFDDTQGVIDIQPNGTVFVN